MSKRHYRLGHGIGRSGDIAEVQPKAAGSSLLNKLTNCMVLDVIRATGTVYTYEELVLLLILSGILVVLIFALLLQHTSFYKKLKQFSKLTHLINFIIWPMLLGISCNGSFQHHQTLPFSWTNRQKPVSKRYCELEREKEKARRRMKEKSEIQIQTLRVNWIWRCWKNYNEIWHYLVN